MKVYVVETPDGPFHEVEMPTPQPKDGQVLVKICASGINPLDTKIRAGQGGHAKQPLPAVLGLDMAGIVEVRWRRCDRFQLPAMRSSAWSAESEVLQGTLAEYHRRRCQRCLPR